MWSRTPGEKRSSFGSGGSPISNDRHSLRHSSQRVSFLILLIRLDLCSAGCGTNYCHGSYSLYRDIHSASGYHYHANASISGFCFSCYVYTYDTDVAPRSRCLRMNGYLRMHSMRRRKHHCVRLCDFDHVSGCDQTLLGPTHCANASVSSSSICTL